MRGIGRDLFCALLVFALLGAMSCSKKSADAAKDQGVFCQLGESAVTSRGLQLIYGLPAADQPRGALPPDWNEKVIPKVAKSEEPGIHRVFIGKELGGEGKVYFCVATRYDVVWHLPDGVKKVAIEPGQPLVLQSYNPVQYGIKWRVQGTTVHVTAYSLLVRYGLDGAPSSKVIAQNADKIGELKLYYQK